MKTICMHGSPLSKYDNRLLWEKYSYRDFGIIGEPYFDIDFSEVLYLTDTGRRWDGEGVSIRDKVSSRKYVENRKNGREKIGRLEGKNRRTRELGDGETGGKKVAGGSGKMGKLEERKDGRQQIGRVEGWKAGSLKDWNEKITLNEKLGLRFRGTQDIVDAAEGDVLPDRIMITVHPQRWGDSLAPWTKEFIWQNVKNVIKWGVVKVKSM